MNKELSDYEFQERVAIKMDSNIPEDEAIQQASQEQEINKDILDAEKYWNAPLHVSDVSAANKG